MARIFRTELQRPIRPLKLNGFVLGPIDDPLTLKPSGHRPKIEQVTTDLNCEVKLSIKAGSFARILYFACDAQLARLDRIDATLRGDLSSEEDRRQVTLDLAQFGDYETGDPLPIFVDTVAAAQDFTRRVLPGCMLGLLTEKGNPAGVILSPPPDERLSRVERETKVHVAVEPVEGANATAVALLRAAVHVMRAIVRSDLAKYGDEIPGAGQEG